MKRFNVLAIFLILAIGFVPIASFAQHVANGSCRLAWSFDFSLPKNVGATFEIGYGESPSQYLTIVNVGPELETTCSEIGIIQEKFYFASVRATKLGPSGQTLMSEWASPEVWFEYRADPGGGGGGTNNLPPEGILTLSLGTPHSPYQPVKPDNLGNYLLEAIDFKVNIESLTHEWEIEGDALVAMPDSGSRLDTDEEVLMGPKVVYQMDIQQAGTYYAWVLARGVDGGSDSLHLGIDGGVQLKQVGDLNRSDFKWVNRNRQGNILTIDLSIGLHDVALYMREDGAKIQAVLFTLDSTFRP